jgi:hypothetical protein
MSAHDLIQRYLAAYKAHDLQAMEACMDPEYTFSDPAFPNLDSEYIFVHILLLLTHSPTAKHSKGMFAMFINGHDTNKMEIEYGDIKKGADDHTVSSYFVSP